MGRVFRLWLPLAASWLLMGAELPIFTLFVARMAEPTVNLAAWGSVVFPVALLIEGPVIMLLAASTALCGDWDSYRKVQRFMVYTAGGLTLLHALVAFTPFYWVVAREWIGAPEQVLLPARLGLRIMLPWTAAIAYRRFQQGVFIRFERSRFVAFGTLVRLSTVLLVLFTGRALGTLPGIVVGSSAIACGVSAEALYSGLMVRPLLRDRLSLRPASETLTTRSFLRFYVPLAMTPLITLLIQPAGASAMSRMSLPLASLAAWPAVHGLVFLTRSSGFAYNEVVVSLLGRPGSVRVLRRFAWALAAVTVSLLALLALTPLGRFWFGSVSGLPADLVDLCSSSLAFAVLMPGYQALQSWYQGVLVHRRRTRGVTEGVLVYSAVALTGLVAGVHFGGPIPGIHWALLSFVSAGIAQTSWLAWRARSELRALEERDSGERVFLAQ